MEDQYEVAYGLSVGTDIDDLEWPWTTVTHHFTLNNFSGARCIEL